MTLQANLLDTLKLKTERLGFRLQPQVFDSENKSKTHSVYRKTCLNNSSINEPTSVAAVSETNQKNMVRPKLQLTSLLLEQLLELSRAAQHSLPTRRHAAIRPYTVLYQVRTEMRKRKGQSNNRLTCWVCGYPISVPSVMPHPSIFGLDLMILYVIYCYM